MRLGNGYLCQLADSASLNSGRRCLGLAAGIATGNVVMAAGGMQRSLAQRFQKAGTGGKGNINGASLNIAAGNQ